MVHPYLVSIQIVIWYSLEKYSRQFSLFYSVPKSSAFRQIVPPINTMKSSSKISQRSSWLTQEQFLCQPAGISLIYFPSTRKVRSVNTWNLFDFGARNSPHGSVHKPLSFSTVWISRKGFFVHTVTEAQEKVVVAAVSSLSQKRFVKMISERDGLSYLEDNRKCIVLRAEPVSTEMRLLDRMVLWAPET